VHPLTVDTYAVQHPGVPERRTSQSLALHLITLCLVIERGADPRDGPATGDWRSGRGFAGWSRRDRSVG
jgi:hypothetical protein